MTIRTNKQSVPHAERNQKHNQTSFGQELSSSMPTQILQLQRKFGNQNVLQMIKQMNAHKQSTPASGVSASAPLQMKWEWEDDTLMGWDDFSDGIKWYYSSESQLLSFMIINKRPTYMEHLAAYEGKPRPYEEWVELWRHFGWTDGLPVGEEGGPVPIFGTDFPKDKDPRDLDTDITIEKSTKKKLEILIRALKAGYRIFDTAELYGDSATLIFEAAKQLDIPVEEIEIIYKVEPEDPELKGSNTLGKQGTDERITNMKSRLRYQMAQIPLTAQRVIMLHEMPENPQAVYAYLTALNEEMSSGQSGAIIGLGVSNVSLGQLKAIVAFTLETQSMRLRFVQNRYSPYNLNTKIVNFCAENGITFMGYGLRGGAGLGACKQGYAMPQEQLQFLQDPRFLAVANELQLDPNQLMIAYAKATGVSLVMYSEGHSGENYDALDITLTSDEVEQIDSLFVFDEETTHSEFSEELGIGLLYQFVKDPTVWFILDMLISDGKIRSLIELVIGEIFETASTEDGVQQIENFAHRLVRFVTHMQVMQQSKMVRDWRIAMQEVFSGLIGQLDTVPDLAKRVFQWSQTDYREIGGALHSMEEVNKLGRSKEEVDEHVVLPEVIEGAPKVGDQLLLNSDNCSLMDEAMDDTVKLEAAEEGVTYYCFFAPDGVTKKGTKHRLFVRIIGPKGGGVVATIARI